MIIFLKIEMKKKSIIEPDVLERKKQESMHCFNLE